jgi:hypothetical protein
MLTILLARIARSFLIGDKKAPNPIEIWRKSEETD